MQKKRRKPTPRDDAGVRLRQTTPGEGRTTRESREAARAARSAASSEGRGKRRRVRRASAPAETGVTRDTRLAADSPAGASRRRRASQKAENPKRQATAQVTPVPAEAERDPRDAAVLQAVLAQQARQKGGRSRRIRQIATGVGALLVIALVLFGVTRGISSVVRWIYTSGQSQQTEAEDQAASKPVQVDLVMVGDILQHMGVYESGFAADGTRNYDHIFAHITSELDGADIKVVNQETILGGEALGFSGYPTFNGPQEMGDAEVKAGFNVVLRATNHAMDYGYEGLSSELAYWRTQHPEVAVLGAADPYDETASVDDIYYYEKDGFRIALLNYTFDLNGIEDERGAVSMLTEEHVRSTVTAADKAADLVVVFPHWGEEYNLEPVTAQYEMADLMVECGADVIIGGHPHVIEPVEVLTASDGHKVPCFWSVGNFVSTQVENETLIGGVAKVTMVKDADGSCSVTACSFVPTVTHKGIGTDMTTYLLRDYTDDLAATNYLVSNDTDNTSLTVAWADEFCTQVLGAGFDVLSKEFVLDPTLLAAGAATPVDSPFGVIDGEGADAETSAEADDGGVDDPIQVG